MFILKLSYKGLSVNFITNKQNLICSFLLLLISNYLYASPLDVSVNIIPRATYTLNEIYIMIEERQNLEHIGSITIQNNTSSAYQAVLRIQLFLDKYSLTEPIADYVTNYDNFTIDVPPNGSYYIDNLDIKEEMVKGGQQIISSDQVEDSIKNTFGDDVIIKTAGMVPEGTYIYKLFVYDKDDTNLTTPLASVVEESFDIPLEDGVIEINTPENNVIINDSYPINFIWQNLLVRPNVNIYYTFKLWEKGVYSTEEVIGLDPLFKTKLETPFQDSLSYDSNYVELKKGNSYVWQVSAIDEAGYPIGNVSASQPYSFTFGEKMSVKIDGVSVYDSYPIVFSWESDPNLEYIVYISQDENFSNSIAVNSSPIRGSQLSLSSLPDQFFPGVNYFWKVVAIQEGEFIESNIGTFTLKKQIISLMNPVNEIIDSDYIQFLWDGSQSKRYKLYLSNSSRMSDRKAFELDTNMFLKSTKELNVSPGETYYWKVVQINESNNEVAESEVSSFSIPKPSPVDLFYPINNQEVSSKPTFSFKKVEWATDYKIIIKHNDNEVIKKDSKNNNVEIDLSSLELLNEDNLTWYVQAYYKDAKVNSDSASFIFIDKNNEDIEVKAKLSLMKPLNTKVNDFNVEFQWIGAPKKYYKLQISKEESFASPLEFNVGNNFYKKVKISLTGKVYWRVIEGNNVSDVGVFMIDSNLKQLTATQMLAIQNMIKSKSSDISNIKSNDWQLTELKPNSSTTTNDLIYLSENFDSLNKVIEL